MNQKFSFKLAAFIATFSGTAFGTGALTPTAWSQTADSLPPVVSTQQAASSQARSNMLAPILPSNGTAASQMAQPAAGMPWKVDRSKYQSAIAPHVPPIIQSNTVARAYPATAAPAVTQPPTAEESTMIDSRVQPATAAFAAAPKAQLSTGFSSAGVPIYHSGNTVAVAPMIPTRPVARVASASQGSGSRSAIGSGIQSTAPTFAPTPGTAPFGGQSVSADPVMPAAPIISSNSEMIVGNAQSVMSTPIQTDPMMHDASGSFVQNPIVNGGTPILSGSAVDRGCSTCNTGGGAVGCESGGNCNCGPGGCYNAADITSKAGLYGSVGEARYYSHIEGLFFDRRNGDVNFASGINLNGFDGNGGLRITLGERFDAINGREFSYSGTAPIESSNTVDGTSFVVPAPFATTDDSRIAIAPFGFFRAALPAIQPQLTPAIVVGQPGIPSTFNPADTLTQSKATYFHTLEFNRVRWGWDVFKSFVGIRYVNLDDEYQLLGVNSNANTPLRFDDINAANAVSGNFQIDATNNLIGPHIGTELFYDVGYRWSVSLNGKLGVYANFNEVSTSLTADGADFVRQDPTSTSFASSVEAGLTAHYQISPRGRFRVGYNVLHFEDVATVENNLPAGQLNADNTFQRVVDRGTGSGVNDNGRMTFLGLAFGIEIFR